MNAAKRLVLREPFLIIFRDEALGAFDHFPVPDEERHALVQLSGLEVEDIAARLINLGEGNGAGEG